jgi:large subunit ribosomal protein L1
MIDKAQFKKAFDTLLSSAPKKQFVQSVDIIINLKDLDLKKPEHQVDVYFQLPHGLGKQRKVCGLVGGELIEHATQVLDKAIVSNDFERLSKKEIKQLAQNYDFFVAQANIMPKVAATFGRILGPRNKMPNPKAGCVVAPKANLVPLKDSLIKTVRLKAKTIMSLQAPIGTQAMTADQLLANAFALYTAVVHALPKEENNVATVYVKLTMSDAVKVI